MTNEQETLLQKKLSHLHIAWWDTSQSIGAPHIEIVFVALSQSGADMHEMYGSGCPIGLVSEVLEMSEQDIKRTIKGWRQKDRNGKLYVKWMKRFRQREDRNFAIR